VNPKEVDLFGLFLEVLVFCDVIADINNDQMQLITCTSKDSNDKIYSFPRASLPHEKQ